MIEVEISDLYEKAQARSDATPEWKRSMRGRPANEVGALGELVSMRFLTAIGVDWTDETVINHDLNSTIGTIDVKTKERTVTPKPHYECTVPQYVKTHQKPDWYAFVSLTAPDKSIEGVRRFSQGWMLGFMEVEYFDRLATLWEPGMKDTSNDYEPHIPHYNVFVNECIAPQMFSRYLKGLSREAA